MIYVIYLRKLNVDNCAQCPGHFGVIYFYLHICDILANFTVIVIVPTCPGHLADCCVQATLELAGACMRADQSVRKRIELENGVQINK